MLRLRRLLLLTTLLAATTLLIAACGGDDDDDDDDAAPTATATATPTATGTAPSTPGSGEATTVAVELVDFAVEPDSSSVPAGEVTFEATNGGSLQHELVIVQTELPFDGLPVESALVPLDPIGFDGTLIGEIEPLDAGAGESLSVTLEPGNYVLLCNVAGHYDLGMRIAFSVE